jgi:hippurate hydrolase
LREWRHHLHANPESAFEEHNTADYLAGELAAMGFVVHRDIGRTGLVGCLKAGDGPNFVGIRADMDCIRLTEHGDLPYKSKTPERMHACGHDGHMTMALGAARLLSERRNFSGTACLVFQPAEEPGYGAHAMLKDGLLQKFPLKEIYGLHNWPGLKAGAFATRPGCFMASEDNFVIRIIGRGAHASCPHMSRDPLVTAAEIILALQTVVARNIEPSQPAVISCTELHTDGVRNAIPGFVEIKGDTRSFSPEVQKLLEERMRAICEGLCALNNATCEFEYTHEFAPTINSRDCVAHAAEAAVNIVGPGKVADNAPPGTGSEDFGAFLEKIPGCFLFIGNGDEGKGSTPLHNSRYDFNDDILATGAEFFAEVIRLRLPA